VWDADKGGKGCFRCVFDLFSTFLRFFSIVFRVFSSFLSFWTCTTTLQRLEKEIGGGTTQMAFEAADHPLPFSSHSLPSRHLPLNLPVPLPTPPPVPLTFSSSSSSSSCRRKSTTSRTFAPSLLAKKSSTSCSPRRNDSMSFLVFLPLGFLFFFAAL